MTLKDIFDSFYPSECAAVAATHVPVEGIVGCGLRGSLILSKNKDELYFMTDIAGGHVTQKPDHYFLVYHCNPKVMMAWKTALEKAPADVPFAHRVASHIHYPTEVPINLKETDVNKLQTFIRWQFYNGSWQYALF